MPMSPRAIAEAKELIGVLEGKKAKYEQLAAALQSIKGDDSVTLKISDQDPEEIKTQKKRLQGSGYGNYAAATKQRNEEKESPAPAFELNQAGESRLTELKDKSYFLANSKSL